VAVGCLGEVAVFDDDDGVDVVDRCAGGAAVTLDTLRDVTERDLESGRAARRLLLNSFVVGAVDCLPRSVDFVLSRALIHVGPVGRLDLTSDCDAAAMFGVDR